MIFQARDGELRIIEQGNAGTTYYLEILFTEGNLSAPVARPQTEEILCTDRGNLDKNTSYRNAPAAARLDPLPLTFTTRAANNSHTDAMTAWLSGVTTVRNHTLYTRKGSGSSSTTPIPQVNTGSAGLPGFADGAKMAYMIEALWSGSGVSNLGYRWDEVYLPPAEQTVTEGAEAVTLAINAQIYGGVTKITAFTTGCTEISGS